MKKFILTAIFASIVSVSFAKDESNYYGKTTDYKKIGWMDIGMEAIKDKINDPESAIFRDVYFNQGRDGIPITCGEINAKNLLGGYIGFQQFISAGKAELTFLQEEVSDFPILWNRLCH